MARPVTLFTGQWADLPLEVLAAKCGEWEFDGLELATWGDHFDVARALSDPGYCAGRRETLERNGLNCWAIGAHLVGQSVVLRPCASWYQDAQPPRSQTVWASWRCRPAFHRSCSSGRGSSAVTPARSMASSAWSR